MPSTDEIRNEIRKTLSDPTPLYALAGAGDLAYQKLREVPGRVEALAADRKAAQDAAVARLHEAQGKLADAQAKVVGTVTALPTDLKSLQGKAQEFALQQAGLAAGLAVKAKEVYDELAERGKVVVTRPARVTGESVTVERAESVPVDVEETEVVEGEPVAETPKPAARKTTRPRKNPDTGK
ncbi:hypothetical protein P3T35_000381 [Kitasatospora sp. GP30]|uniref:hypothetical protein n=1 Tax=Kitasatospora sp. GP30 TaxID=3035084 RepID=UPI000C6FCEE4|nr:hypothetical protein [Kitasatospora sp. GP30]MDH6138404.1 hypothetical protein [Kitasatospora sp. GP30]